MSYYKGKVRVVIVCVINKRERDPSGEECWTSLKLRNKITPPPPPPPPPPLCWPASSMNPWAYLISNFSHSSRRLYYPALSLFSLFSTRFVSLEEGFSINFRGFRGESWWEV